MEAVEAADADVTQEAAAAGARFSRFLFAFASTFASNSTAAAAALCEQQVPI